MGLGIGIIFTSFILYVYTAVSLNMVSKEKIESMARDMGMEYVDKIKSYDLFENKK